jgi:hypothetical protein
LKKNEFFLSIKKNRKMMMLILTNKNMFLFFLKKQKILILSFHKLNQIKFFRRFELSKIQKFIKIKIFPLLFFSKFLFGIAGINNLLQIYNFKEKKKSIKLIFSQNFSIFKATNFFLFDNQVNIVGNNFFAFFNALFVKISLEKLLFYDYNNLIFENKKNPNKFYKILKFSLDKNGKKMAFLYSNGEIKIWNSNPFLTLNFERKKKIISYHRKKLTNLCISEDGNILGISIFKTLILWEIFPRFQKFKSLTFELKNSISNLNFFYYKKKTYIILNTKKDLFFLETSKFSIDIDLKINVLNIMIDAFYQRYLLFTSCFLPIQSTISKFIMVFQKNSPIPILTLKLDSITKGQLVSVNFSFFPNNKKLKSLLMVDSFLEFHKIFFK